jgi:hypothetical protein
VLRTIFGPKKEKVTWGWAVLKCILKKQSVKAWIGFSWLRMESTYGGF